MFAATTSPSYSPTCVSGQMPVTSPIAHSRSPRACTRQPRSARVGLDADRLQADPCTRGRRPVHTSRRSPRCSVRHRTRGRLLAVEPRGAGVHPEHQLDPSRRRARRAPCPAARAPGVSPGRSLRPAPPRRRGAGRSARSRCLPTRRRARAGGAARPSCSSPRGYPTRPPARAAPGPGARTVGAVATTTCSGVPDAVDLDDASARQPSVPRISPMP